MSWISKTIFEDEACELMCKKSESAQGLLMIDKSVEFDRESPLERNTFIYYGFESVRELVSQDSGHVEHKSSIGYEGKGIAFHVIGEHILVTDFHTTAYIKISKTRILRAFEELMRDDYAEYESCSSDG